MWHTVTMASDADYGYYEAATAKLATKDATRYVNYEYLRDRA